MRRLNAAGNAHHFFSGRHFQIHAGLQRLRQQFHIPVIDMPAVFTQVHGNAIRTGLLRDQRGLYRLRVAGATSLAKSGDMIRRTREELDIFKTRLKVQSSKLKTPAGTTTNRNRHRASLPRAFNFEL